MHPLCNSRIRSLLIPNSAYWGRVGNLNSIFSRFFFDIFYPPPYISFKVRRLFCPLVFPAKSAAKILLLWPGSRFKDLLRLQNLLKDIFLMMKHWIRLLRIMYKCESRLKSLFSSLDKKFRCLSMADILYSVLRPIWIFAPASVPILTSVALPQSNIPPMFRRLLLIVLYYPYSMSFSCSFLPFISICLLIYTFIL